MHTFSFFEHLLTLSAPQVILATDLAKADLRFADNTDYVLAQMTQILLFYWWKSFRTFYDAIK